MRVCAKCFEKKNVSEEKLEVVNKIFTFAPREKYTLLLDALVDISF